MVNHPSTPIATTFTRASEQPAPKYSFIMFGVAAAAIIAWDAASVSHHDNDNHLPPKSPAPIHHAHNVKPLTVPKHKLADSVEKAIRQAARSCGLDVSMLRAFASIESGGNPKARTGRYHGLFQLSAAEFASRGGTNIYDPYDNARIAAIKLKGEADQFARKFGRSPTPFDMYMVHQRGLAGYEQHLKSPDALAWTALYNTSEGRKKGDGWARKTITQNLPRAVLARMGGVERITNRQFIEWWRSRYEREAGQERPTQIRDQSLLRVICVDFGMSV
jgi:Transglycosylase SLT domain